MRFRRGIQNPCVDWNNRGITGEMPRCGFERNVKQFSPSQLGEDWNVILFLMLVVEDYQLVILLFVKSQKGTGFQKLRQKGTKKVEKGYTLPEITGKLWQLVGTKLE